jgi:MFS family permease
VAAGLVNTAFGGLAPLYAVRIGLSAGEVGQFMSAVFFGALLLQWPLGRLSDRVDRRRVIAGVLLGVGGLALAIALFGGISHLLLLALGIAYGGFAYTVYSLSLSHAHDFATQAERMAISAGMLLSWAAGSIAGPTIAGFAMDHLGPQGLFYYLATVAMLVFVFALWRMTRRPSPAAAPFVARTPTTPAAADMDPRTDAA